MAITANSEPVRSYTRHCAHPEDRDHRQDDRRVGALEVERPEHHAVYEGREPDANPGAEGPVEERAEEELLRHRRDHDHGQRNGEAAHEVVLAEVLHVGRLDAEQLDVAELEADHQREREHRPADGRPQPGGADAEVPAPRGSLRRREQEGREESSPSCTSSSTSRTIPATASDHPYRSTTGMSGMPATMTPPRPPNSAAGACQGGHGGRAAAGSSGGSGSGRPAAALKGAAPRRSRARGRAGRAQREVARRDGRCEAVVEELRDPERGVHAVPAGLQRQLVGAQHARVEEPQQLDVAEHALAELAELAPRGTPSGARGCPTSPPRAARASARWGWTRTRRRPASASRGSGAGCPRGRPRARSSGGTRRRRTAGTSSPPARARSGCPAGCT